MQKHPARSKTRELERRAGHSCVFSVLQRWLRLWARGSRYCPASAGAARRRAHHFAWPTSLHIQRWRAPMIHASLSRHPTRSFPTWAMTCPDLTVVPLFEARHPRAPKRRPAELVASLGTNDNGNASLTPGSAYYSRNRRQPTVIGTTTWIHCVRAFRAALIWVQSPAGQSRNSFTDSRRLSARTVRARCRGGRCG